jgi:hypothetical protein
MIARIFMCIPYARRKSHRRRTSESGGVHAEKVKTAIVNSSQDGAYMETHKAQLEDS